MRGNPTTVVRVPAHQLAYAERASAARIERMIQAEFPGHPFTVSVSLMNFMATIEHPLMPEGIGIRVRLQDENQKGARAFTDPCAELLERYSIPRSGIGKLDPGRVFTLDDAADALGDIK